MADSDQQAKLIAAALYEVRLLLGPGNQRPDGAPATQAAALAYGLHNEALALLEGRDFDVEQAWRRLARMDERLGSEVRTRLRFYVDAGERHAKYDGEGRTQIQTFALAVRAFCTLAEGLAPELLELARVMSALHVAALDLPDVEAERDAPEPNTPGPLGKLTLPFDIYWDMFDPFTTPPEKPVANSFYDDISDIRHDLRRGLDLYDRGFPLAACWEWRCSFRTHWGEHLVGAQHALYLARRNELAP